MMDKNLDCTFYTRGQLSQVSKIGSILNESVSDYNAGITHKVNPITIAMPVKKESFYQQLSSEAKMLGESTMERFTTSLTNIVYESVWLDKEFKESHRQELVAEIQNAIKEGFSGGLFAVKKTKTLGRNLYESCMTVEKTAGFLTEASAEFTASNIDDKAIIEEVKSRVKDAVEIQSISAELNRADIDSIASLDQSDSPEFTPEAKMEAAMVSFHNEKYKKESATLMDVMIANYRSAHKESTMDQAFGNALVTYTLFETMKYLNMLNMNTRQLNTLKENMMYS